MVRDVVITGAGLPVVRSFATELLRQKPRSLALCSDLTDLGQFHDGYRQCQQELAPSTKLRFCSFSGTHELPSLDAALQRSASPLLFHGRTRRSAVLAQDNPCDAVHQNLLLTRQVLQVVISTGTASFAFLSSDLALQTDTVLGAAFAAAEASVLEAAQCCPYLAMAVVRFPSHLDPIQRNGLPMELAWRQEAAARAAVQAIAANTSQVMLSWPDPLGVPQELQSQPLSQAVSQPQWLLIDWLQQISSPLQAYQNATVARALLDLWIQQEGGEQSVVNA
jgi:hypothetical protein